jgi:hypothetical protein
MAIWRFGVILIPKSAISSEGEALPFDTDGND